MFFWEVFEVLPWFEGTILQEKEEQVLRFSFQQFIVKNALKNLSMNVLKYLPHLLKICLSEMLTHYES